ncbi:MAG: ROK family protein, partial [Acidobacteriota bacterium]|nr:ROK family protein [Acidobacteriota bacterium]
PVAHARQVLQAPTVAGPCPAGFDLPGEIRRASGREVTVLNDVSAAAWHLAEWTEARRFLVVTVSSGIGSKIFDRCHAARVLDQPPYAGEIGHVVVDDRADAPVCDCGGRGHLGAIASGRGIERRVRQLAQTETGNFSSSSIMRQFGATANTVNNEQHIVPAVLARDPWVTRIVRDCTRPLVRSLLTITMAAGLEKIFVIGGFANALGQLYVDLLCGLAGELSRYEIAQSCLPGLFEGMGDSHETCLEGCAAYLRGNRMGVWL